MAGTVLLWSVYAELPLAAVLTKVLAFLLLAVWGGVLDRELHHRWAGAQAVLPRPA